MQQLTPILLTLLDCASVFWSPVSLGLLLVLSWLLGLCVIASTKVATPSGSLQPGALFTFGNFDQIFLRFQPKCSLSHVYSVLVLVFWLLGSWFLVVHCFLLLSFVFVSTTVATPSGSLQLEHQHLVHSLGPVHTRHLPWPFRRTSQPCELSSNHIHQLQA